MTEEERQRLQAELLRKQQADIAMLSQSSMTPEELAQLTEQAGYDPSGREAMLASMLRGGQDAVFGDMPQGTSVGGIYVQPSWAESLNAAAQKVVGGYQVGQARREQKEIDAQRAQAATAQEQIDAEAARVKSLGQAQSDLADMVDTEADNARDERRLTQAAEIARLNREAADKRHGLTLAARQTGGGGGSPRGSKNEPTRFIDPYSGTELMAAFDKASGTYFSPITGQPIPPDQMEGKIREDAMTEGQREKAVQQFIDRNKDTFALMHDIEKAEETWVANGMTPGENPFNWFTKQTGVLGDAARAISDIGEKGSPTQDDYAAAQTTINTISRLRAGLSQTVAELERIRTETGQDALASPDVFMKYWGRLKSKVGNDIAMANKTASPRTIQAYQRWEGQKAQSNAPMIGMEDFAPAPPAATGLTPEEQRELEELERRFGGGP